MTGLQVVHALQQTGLGARAMLTLGFIAGPVLLGACALLVGVRMPAAA